MRAGRLGRGRALTVRILASVHQFPPDDQTGTEILCLRTMAALRERGHKVLVVTADRRKTIGDPPRRETVDGVETVFVPSRRPGRLSFVERLRDEYDRPDVAQAALAQASAFRPDVVHVHHLQRLGLGTAAGLARLAPVIVTATDFHLACAFATAVLPDGEVCAGPDSDAANCLAHHRLGEARGHRPELWGPHAAALLLWRQGRVALSRLRPDQAAAAAAAGRLTATSEALGAASLVLAGSERIRAMLAVFGTRAPIEVLPHAAPPVLVPAGAFDPARLRFGFLGTLSGHKGAHILVEALRMLPRDLPIEVTFRGPAPNRRYAASLAEGLRGDARGGVLEPVPYARFGEALRDVDVAVLPSLWPENNPLILLSALEAGRYALVSDVPGLAGAVDEPRGGRAFPPGDAAALASLMRDLVEDPSPVLRARETPVRASDFSAYVDVIEARYGAVLAALRPGGAHPP